MRVLVSGASGLIGRAVVEALARAGAEVVKLVRSAVAEPGAARWSPVDGWLEDAAARGADAVVHLAGESIAGRWTAARKRAIRQSRVEGTRTLVGGIARLSPRPRVLVAASAVGFYGDRGDEELDETSAPGSGFLADVCREWEQASEEARALGIRVVRLRFGVVLAPNGGALGRMLPVFRLGLGGRLGSGRQWMSWIGIEDAVSVVRAAIDREELSGPVNAVAPCAVTNAEFTRTLGEVVGRGTPLAVPGSLLRLAVGEMADEALLASVRALPRALAAAGFPFARPTLRQALRSVLGRPSRS